MRGAWGVFVMVAAGLALVSPSTAGAVTLRPGDVIAAYNDPPDSIAKIDPRTGARTVIATGDHIQEPWQVAVTPNGQILVAELGDRSILSINPRTGAQTAISTGPGFHPLGVARAASGKLIVSDNSAGSILSIDPRTGIQTPISSGGSLGDPAQLAVAPNGRIFVADEGTNPGVYAIDPRTGAQTAVATAGLSDPFSVALSANSRRVLFVDYSFGTDGAILSVAASGGPLSTISSGQLFDDPISLARSFRGPLFVAEQDGPDGDGQIVRVNPRTGQQSTLNLAGPELSLPGGVAVVPPRCFGRFATIVGSPRADRLKGTRFPDVIAGAGGNDRIRGLGGGDKICGGKGRDRLFGGRGRDRLQGGPGRDRLFGGRGRDRLRGGPGRDLTRQ